MIINLQGDPDILRCGPNAKIQCSPDEPASKAIYPQLATRHGHCSLNRLEILGMLEGRLKKIDAGVPPSKYGMKAGEEWNVWIRTPPIPEYPTKCMDGTGSQPCMVTAGASPLTVMQWSRPAKKPKPSPPTPSTKKQPSSLPKKAYMRRLANAPSVEQQTRAMRHYSFVVNDHLISRDFSRGVLAEVVQLHLKSRLSPTSSPHNTTLTAQDETHGGISCFVSGDHHGFIRKWLRLVDSYTAAQNLDLGPRSQALVSCYPAGGAAGSLHSDAANDKTRKLTVTMFLQQQGSTGGELKMATQSNEVVIAPLIGRVVTHWSDARCRHAIKATGSQAHYSITVWYGHKDLQSEQEAEADQERRNHMGVTLAAARACLAAAVVAVEIGVVGRPGKKRKKRKSKKCKAKTTQAVAVRQEDSEEDDSDDDNWMAWCAALRSALTASLAVAVAHANIPPLPQPAAAAPTVTAAPLPNHSDCVSAFVPDFTSLTCNQALKKYSRLRRRVEAHMAAHEEAVEDIIEDAAEKLRELARCNLPLLALN